MQQLHSMAPHRESLVDHLSMMPDARLVSRKLSAEAIQIHLLGFLSLGILIMEKKGMAMENIILEQSSRTSAS